MTNNTWIFLSLEVRFKKQLRQINSKGIIWDEKRNQIKEREYTTVVLDGKPDRSIQSIWMKM